MLYQFISNLFSILLLLDYSKAFDLTFEQFLETPLNTLPVDLVTVICDGFNFSPNLTAKDVAVSLHTSVPYYFEERLYFFNRNAEIIGSISATLDNISDSSTIKWEDIVNRVKSGEDFVSVGTKTEEGITVYEEAINYLHEIYKNYKEEITKLL